MNPRRSSFAWRVVLGLALALGAVGCAHAPGPVEVASNYARALEEGRLAEASALTSASAEERSAFLQRYADPQARQARVVQVRSALSQLQAHSPGLSLLQAKEGWRVVEEKPADDAPRQLLTRFAQAVEGGHWEAAWALLSEPLRERYTPERLHEDFQREPLATERLRRAWLAAEGPVRVTEEGAEFALGAERAVRLVREAGEYRVAALE